ncbi:MAG: pyridoxamine 5'-phosphate oxidase family protein [Haloferacaceae archaeon]
MDHIDYEYTVGMDDAEVAERLDSHHVGVLSLAKGDDAYAVPVDYRYEDGRLLLRLTDDGDSKKVAYADATDEACFLVYGPDEAWSIVALGRLDRLGDTAGDDFADRTLNEWFGTLRVFDEDVADLDVVVYELHVESLTGRTAA